MFAQFLKYLVRWFFYTLPENIYFYYLKHLIFINLLGSSCFRGKNAVLSCFTNGRATGLVIYSGATYTPTVPMYDGHVLNQGIMPSPLVSDFIVRQTQKYIESQKIEPVPIYKVTNKVRLI